MNKAPKKPRRSPLTEAQLKRVRPIWISGSLGKKALAVKFNTTIKSLDYAAARDAWGPYAAGHPYQELHAEIVENTIEAKTVEKIGYYCTFRGNPS
jgi:hypothetical protein